MKTLSTKNLFTSVIMAYLLLLFLEGCQKEMQINNSAGVIANLDLVKSKIIYTDIIPNVTMTSKNNISHYYKLDLNNDDTTDFEIEAFYGKSSMFTPPFCGVEINSLKKNRVACYTGPLVMNPGDTVGSNLNWVYTPPGVLRETSFNRSLGTWITTGNWTDSTDHYLGLKIKSGSNTYYGWVRLRVWVSPSPPLQSSVIIKDYAYNGIPNKPILTGQMK